GQEALRRVPGCGKARPKPGRRAEGGMKATDATTPNKPGERNIQFQNAGPFPKQECHSRTASERSDWFDCARRCAYQENALGDLFHVPVLPLRAFFDCVFRQQDRKSTRLNSSHQIISYPVFCLYNQLLIFLI